MKNNDIDELDLRDGEKISQREEWTATFKAMSTTAVVLGATLLILSVLHPSLILRNNTPTGGDMGAHVWGPAYMRDHLLPSFRVTGWTQDWYAGFPAYHFYMVLPSLAIALLSLVLPYGLAFKLVAVSGLLTLPIACWAFCRFSSAAISVR